MKKIRTGLAYPLLSAFSRASRPIAALASCVSPLALMAQDLPVGGTVVAGQAQITSPTSTQMTITQSTDTAVINWNSFDVGSGALLQFDQPTSSSATLNRVTGSAGSDIHGQITANGSVFVVNPNGIFIGADGSIQAGGGFVASTLDVTNDDFQNGNLRFEGNGASATVENAGTITVGRGGYAALLGGHVANSGTISVPMGRIAFGSGERVTLDLSGDGFLQVAVPTEAISEEGQALIEHSGSVAAEGGRIEMKAATAREAVRQAVNLSGIAEATSVQQRGGTIILGGGAGGQVQVSGRVSARAEIVTAVETSVRPQTRPAQGGDITITGVDIALSSAEIDASGAEGGGRIRIGGDFAGAGDLPRAETVIADVVTTLTSDALDDGDGGRIVVWSDEVTEFAGTISARGGDTGGDGGFVEVSSAQTLTYTGRTNTTAALGATGTLLLDPTDFIIDTVDEEIALEADLVANNVVLNTNSNGNDIGNIIISRDIDWATENSLTLIANNDITLTGALNGVNGQLILNAANNIVADGAVNVGQFVLQSGNWRQVGPLPAFFAGNFELQGGEFLRAASGNGEIVSPFEIVDVYGLQGIGSSERMLQSNFVLGADIDASTTRGWSRAIDGGTTFGFVPIGNNGTPFSGSLNGNLNAINGLFISDTVRGFGSAALFSANAGTIRLLSLDNVDFTGGRAAGLAISNTGLIEAVQVSGRVTGGAFAAGLVDGNQGTIRSSVSNVDVSLDDIISSYGGFLSIGGLVATNSGTIADSQSLGNVTAQPSVSGSINLVVGGLAGRNSGSGSISDSSASGNVNVIIPGPNPTTDSSTIDAGGFVGEAMGGAITGATASGTINVENNSAATVQINTDFGGTIVDPIPVVDPVPIPDPVIVTIINLPNPPDTLGGLDLSGPTLTSADGGGSGSGGAVTSGVADALEGQAEAQVAANGLVSVAEACAGGEDVDTVLACLSDALDAFGTELDTILLQLPPELGDVAQIIENARDGVDAARRRAAARLATATTEAERDQIRNEALIEARASIDAAALLLRQRISLVRADDPDLATVQQATISVVADAVENVGVELARATDL